MKRIPLMCILVGLPVLTAACGEGPTDPAAETDAFAPRLDATAAPTRTSFRGYIYFCSAFGPDQFWVTPGGTSHIRKFGNVNQWVVGNPLIDGIDMAELDGNNFIAHGPSTLVPSDPGVDGTWKTENHVDLRGPVTNHGTGHGTGDLRGMSMQFWGVGVSIPPAPPPPAGCDQGPPNAVQTWGIITTPAGL
jgi:hypothetical protein